MKPILQIRVSGKAVVLLAVLKSPREDFSAKNPSSS